MKVSLNWIFDHINGQLATVDVPSLVNSFIKTTAEIESWKKTKLDTERLSLVQIIEKKSNNLIVVQCPEYNKNCELQFRSDALIGSWYLVTHDNDNVLWTSAIDLGGTKEMLLPAVDIAEPLRAGGWKDIIEIEDYIIDVDNKSINSRPDLWGHRGIAREIAAILNMQLKPLENFITTISVVNAETHVVVGSFTADIESPDVCSRFAVLYINSITSKPSQLSMLIRLSRLDSRAIDLLVDTTNYVMLDLGQPMHAFDAVTLPSKRITVRRAKTKEQLKLLDSQTIELCPEDLVITDGNQPISLAGVMGGFSTGISTKTDSVLLESAHFDATVIRRAAARHKKRTDASARFEKNIDPNQNVNAIKRFLYLLKQADVEYHISGSIASLGNSMQQKNIVMEHAFIQKRLGVLIKPAQVISILEKLFFTVVQSAENNEIQYNIGVPSFRATKDISIPEDIVEEVGRYIGYDTLPRVMPCLQLQPHNLHKTYTIRRIKELLSYGFEMRELYGYSFFDESVLRELAWNPIDTVMVKNPISENYTRLVTTLQPHMLKAVAENSIMHTKLRFFEWGRVWRLSGENVFERKSLTGIFFDQQGSCDFYEGKQFVSRIFSLLHMNVLWQPCETVEFPWYCAYQTAMLMHEGNRIGIAGMVTKDTVVTLSCAGGSAFIFEFDGDYLLDHKKTSVQFDSLSKYPLVRRDISILISLLVTADTLIALISLTDTLIQSVTLIDFFTRPDWKDQKAMTFHLEIGSKEKTLTADEVEKVYENVVFVLQKNGAVIR